ncbi:hypothetical protein DB88DRAFT_151850 [Papiliotrema laurentii]|uniref:Uncharacterized protein n=1 Tax=Papiliotrema laurentii TaxID=5418 RepID=A0AAD9FTV9_PAPLA|nr:hypothetical protein DB88DRAFT_151850 [Papiliotrema laurentii]
MRRSRRLTTISTVVLPCPTALPASPFAAEIPGQTPRERQAMDARGEDPAPPFCPRTEREGVGPSRAGPDGHSGFSDLENDRAPFPRARAGGQVRRETKQ